MRPDLYYEYDFTWTAILSLDRAQYGERAATKGVGPPKGGHIRTNKSIQSHIETYKIGLRP